MKYQDVTFLTILHNIWIDIKDSFKEFYNSPNPDYNHIAWIWWILIMGILCTIDVILFADNLSHNLDIDRCGGESGAYIIASIFIFLIGIIVNSCICYFIGWIIGSIQEYIEHYKRKFPKPVEEKNNYEYHGKDKQNRKILYNDTIIIDGQHYEMGEECNYYRDSYGDEYISYEGKFREITKVK